MKYLYAGADVGASRTKVVIMDEEKLEGIRAALHESIEEHGAIANEGLKNKLLYNKPKGWYQG